MEIASDANKSGKKRVEQHRERSSWSAKSSIESMKQPRNERCKQHIEALIAQVSAFREDISKAYENPETDIKASILLARIRSFAEQREESEARMIAHTKALKDACETLAEELNSVVNNQLLELEAAFPDEAFAKTTPDAPSPAK